MLGGGRRGGGDGEKTSHSRQWRGRSPLPRKWAAKYQEFWEVSPHPLCGMYLGSLANCCWKLPFQNNSTAFHVKKFVKWSGDR